jgi:site-specific DNA-methyltransferase (adenine-specific)
MVDLKCGDCLELMKNISNESIDLIITDPPYPTTSRGSAGNSGGMLQKEINKRGKVFNFNNITCKEYAPEFYRVLKNGSHCYVMTNHVNLVDMLNTFINNGFHFIKCLIWDKGNKIMGQYYMSQFEYILFFRKGKGKKINNCGTSDILSIKNNKTKDKNGKNLHDTEKPIELMKILIENSSIESQKVLDPFMGIGSTGVASVITNRSFTGIEIDEHYFKIAKKRIEKEIDPFAGLSIGG